jgi:type IV secretion system protein VirB8
MKKKGPVEAEGFDEYLSETRGLERDFVGELVNSRRLAWRVATGFGALAGVATLGMLGIVAAYRNPPPPPVFTVDKATGHVDMVTTLANDKINPGWAVDKQYINTYVLNREGYDFNSLQLFYNTTGLMSSERVQREYGAIWQGKDARDKQLGDSAVINVDVKSIVQGPDNSATVRFATTTRYNNGNTIGPVNYIATVAYRYVGAPMKEDDRRIDALGFQITAYRVDPEVVGVAPPTAVAPTAVAVPGTATLPAAPAAPATAGSVTVPALVAPGTVQPHQ